MTGLFVECGGSVSFTLGAESMDQVYLTSVSKQKLNAPKTHSAAKTCLNRLHQSFFSIDIDILNSVQFSNSFSTDST